MKTKHLNPADYVIHLLGGVRPAARALGKAPSTVSYWTHAERNGAIPAKVRTLILAYAKDHDLPITSEDLDFGRKVQV